MIVELAYIIIMLCMFFSVKYWIDKRKYLKHLQVQHDYQSSLPPIEIYNICKSKIKEGELQLNRFAKNKTLRIIWDPTPKPPNASASFPFLIILTGDWSFLADSSLDSKAYLYSTLGHELAHKDNEPLYSFHKSTHNLKNHVREIRADFCGLSFAMNYFEDRNFIIQSKYKYKVNKDNCNTKTDHPSHKVRKQCMEKFDCFSRAVIEYIINQKEYCDINEKTNSVEYIGKLEEACYKGRIFRKGSF